jgi:signal transduction histidine kinase
MREPMPSRASEREIYRDYERSRRLALARILLPVFALVQCAVFLVSLLVLLRAQLDASVVPVFGFNTALVGVDAALHAVGLYFVRRRQVGGATLCVGVPAGITILGPALVWNVFYRPPAHTISPELPITLAEVAATLVLIALAGLLATNWRILVGTTLLLNGYTLFVLAPALGSPDAGAALHSYAVLILVFPLLAQWAAAGVLVAAGSTYLQTLRELGDVRVAFAQAQRLDQLKDEFITHVNHELRSPIMALQGHIELLLLAEDQLSPDERHAYLERAKHAGDDLVALVTSILSVRRLEEDRDSIMPSAVDVRAALDSAIDLTGNTDGSQVERALRVHIPDGLEVWAEPVRLRQILTNLLSNALKYSPPGTPVDVAAELVPVATAGQPAARSWQRPHAWRTQGGQASAPGMVQISVRDHGLGIPPDQLSLLFRRFVRLPRDLASNVPGNGLGLYLCHSLATAMGGTIWAESTGVEGEGTTFYVRLPAPAEAQLPQRNQTDAGSADRSGSANMSGRAVRS